MSEKTKRREKTEPPDQKESENAKKGNWSEDQREKSYYYDDSYGYEIYNPDEDEEDEKPGEQASCLPFFRCEARTNAAHHHLSI